MTIKDYAFVIAIWVGYAVLAAGLAWVAVRLTRDAAKWQRRALVSLVLAVLFAPSVVGGGHGGGIGPAWMALGQMFPIKLGVFPILITFVVCFVAGTIISRLGESKKHQ